MDKLTDEGVDVTTLSIDVLLELCEQGDHRACQELERQGVERPSLPLLEPEPEAIAGRYVGSDVPGLCRECGDSIGVHDRETLACPSVTA